MKKTIVLCILLIAPGVFCLAQKQDNKIPVLKITGLRENEYTITPKDYYLFGGCSNKIMIETNDTTRIAEISLSNGKIIRKGPKHGYEISDLKPGITLLTIYERAPGGKKTPVKNKQYQVTDYPKLKFAGVRCDSAISTLMLCGGLFMAEDKETKMRIPVMSFKMDIMEKGVLKIDSVMGNKLSKSMREYVSSLSSGKLIYLTDIKYKLPDNSIHKVPVFRLYLINRQDQPIGF
jgi:hypothetical protein